MTSTGVKITIDKKQYVVYEGDRGGFFHKKGGNKTYLTEAQKKENNLGQIKKNLGQIKKNLGQIKKNHKKVSNKPAVKRKIRYVD